jgi:hypothetical protein
MRWMNIKRTAKAAAALVAFAACGQAVDNRGEDLGDIRGVEELGSPNLTALASGDAVFNATTGIMAVTLQGTETLLQVSKRASDSAILLNGVPVVDTTGATIAFATALKRMNVTVGADGTTVIFDYYNGTFNAGIKPTSPATFGTAGTVVAFGAHMAGAFKVRGTSGNDTIYAGQDALMGTPNVLVSFSGTNADIEVSATTMPSLGFNLGVGTDVFDAFSAKGGTLHTLTFPVSVHGGVGNDTLIGGSGADSLYGDEGANVIDESSFSVAHTADNIYGLTTPASVVGTNTTTVTYATWPVAAAAGVTVRIAHLATGLIGGVTDNVDDSVTAVIGSPKNDTIACSQLTDVPCYVQGMGGDDTLSPGLSVTSTHYLFGGDGNDTFVMTLPASKVFLVGGNIGDITTTKNNYTDTVDYSGAISAGNVFSTTISMNGTAPLTCSTVVTATTPIVLGPPCAGTIDPTPSGFAGFLHTDIRKDITVAKCPTGALSATAVCTVKGNAAGDKIYSGFGSDVLTGGAGDDTFVFAPFNAAGTYTPGTATKVATGGGGNDTADFSLHVTSVAVRLDCVAATCDNSGNPATGITAADTTASTTATADATTSASDATTLATDFAALATPVADDIAVDSAAVSANSAAQAAATALAAAVAAPTNFVKALAVKAAAVTATTAAAASVAANTAHTAGDAGVLADAVAVATQATAIAALASSFASVSESISLVNINNAVCPVSGTNACAVVTNAGADIIDFNNDGAVAGSSLTCNSSDVTLGHATGLVNNCGI